MGFLGDIFFSTVSPFTLIFVLNTFGVRTTSIVALSARCRGLCHRSGPSGHAVATSPWLMLDFLPAHQDRADFVVVNFSWAR